MELANLDAIWKNIVAWLMFKQTFQRILAWLKKIILPEHCRQSFAYYWFMADLFCDVTWSLSKAMI